MLPLKGDHIPKIGWFIQGIEPTLKWVIKNKGKSIYHRRSYYKDSLSERSKICPEIIITQSEIQTIFRATNIESLKLL